MTETTAEPLTITRIVVPETLHSADAGPFLEMARLSNAVCLEYTGHDYLNEEPGEMLGFWQDQADWGQTGFVAERAGVIVGAAKLIYSQETTTSLDFDV